jgi:hypothetical protein
MTNFETKIALSVFHFNAAPATGKNFDAAPAPPLLCSAKPTFLKQAKVNTRVRAIFTVLQSRSRKEPQLLVGAGAVMRCGSGTGSGGSGSVNGIKHS